MIKHILLTISLILFANTVAATSLSIKHNKKLPTPYEIITKGTILHKYSDDNGDPVYYIAWDKTDDIYSCGLMLVRADCYLLEQSTRIAPK